MSVTKFATAVTAGGGYYRVLFEFNATSAIRIGRGTTAASGRDEVGRGGATAWRGASVRVVVDGRDHHNWNLGCQGLNCHHCPLLPNGQKFYRQSELGREVTRSAEGRGGGDLHDGEPFIIIFKGGVIYIYVLGSIV